MSWRQQYKFGTTTMTTTFNIKISETINLTEYKLMYFFGTWVTKTIIPAECDAEAIFDADEAYNNSNLKNWQYPVALWCGNRRVKNYNDRNIYNA